MPIIRKMISSDSNKVSEMMKVFYSSPAVFTDGSDEIFKKDIEECVSDSPFLEGLVLEENGEILGYAMLAKSFSTEFGKRCVWIEDIYLLPECRGKGFGTKLLDFVSDKYPECVIRLEAEEENAPAVKAYEKNGFKVLPYLEMIKNC